jgi:hypothetical protein
LSDFLLSQILAGLAFVCGLVSFQFPGRRSVLIWLVLMSVFSAAHFFVLGRPGPAVIVVVGGLKFLTAVFSTNRQFMFFFLFATIVGFFWVYRSPLSFLTLVAGMLGTWGGFHPDEKTMRVAIMICTAIWIVHNVLAWTPVGAVMEIFILISAIGGYRHHYAGEAYRREG